MVKFVKGRDIIGKFEPIEKYIKGEEIFLSGESITKAANQVEIDRKKLSRYLRSKGHEFESRQPNTKNMKMQ